MNDPRKITVEELASLVDEETLERAAAACADGNLKPAYLMTDEEIQEQARQWAEYEVGLTDSGEPRRKG